MLTISDFYNDDLPDDSIFVLEYPFSHKDSIGNPMFLVNSSRYLVSNLNSSVLIYWGIDRTVYSFHHPNSLVIIFSIMIYIIFTDRTVFCLHFVIICLYCIRDSSFEAQTQRQHHWIANQSCNVSRITQFVILFIIPSKPVRHFDSKIRKVKSKLNCLNWCSRQRCQDQDHDTNPQDQDIQNVSQDCLETRHCLKT